MSYMYSYSTSASSTRKYNLNLLQKFLDDNYQLLKFLNVQSMEPKSVKVKLTRL